MADKSFELKFKMNNSVFDDSPLTEVIRILNEVRMELSLGETYGKIMDANGNSIGNYKVKGTELW